jgi:anti-sigma factor RsiW
MTDMTHEQIRDSLPDVVHATIDDGRRREIEEHLRSCAECASEMRVLQMVKDAPSFAPMIDAVKVSSKILPYGGVPARQVPRNTRRWMLLTAAIAVAVLVAVPLIRSNKMSRSDTLASVEEPASPEQTAALIRDTSRHLPSVVVSERRTVPAVQGTATHTAKAHELQAAVGLDDLSDGSLAQLASDLDGLDGLPSAEPENLGVADPAAGSGGEQ